MPIIIILVVIVVIFAAILSWQADKKRREDFQALAARLGMRYTQQDSSIATQYACLDALRQGSNRYAKNILTGLYRDHSVCCFDYHYETHSTDSKGNRQTHHHWFSFFVLELPRHFPELRIYPETWLGKIGQALGYADIDFESAEFSRKFTVRSPDKKFAYDVVNGPMMEHLLAHPQTSLEVDGTCLAAGASSLLKPEEIEARFNQLVDIRGLFPEYLFRD